jgi:hypothetical protein
MDEIDNPFLETAKPPVETDADAIDNPFLVESAPQAQGEITNDIGRKVIVPKDGESFEDTMKRVRQYGSTVTQADIDAEMATAPGKARTVLEAAPLIGAGGVAALAGAGEAPGAVGGAAKAIKAMAQAHPVAASLVRKALEGLAFGAGAGEALKHTGLKEIIGLLGK